MITNSGSTIHVGAAMAAKDFYALRFILGQDRFYNNFHHRFVRQKSSD